MTTRPAEEGQLGHCLRRRCHGSGLAGRGDEAMIAVPRSRDRRTVAASLAILLATMLLSGRTAAASDDNDDSGGDAATTVPSPPPRPINLRGCVLTRGSITPVPGAVIIAGSGETTTTDGHGRFALALPDGANEFVIRGDEHQILRVHETLRPGEGLAVEYALSPLPEHGRYQSTVRGEARHEGERFALRGEELRTLPGALGDPFRAVGLLPGVATPITLLPLYVIRGASPGMNGFFLDGMRVPQLFHLLVGGGVVHGRLVDRIDFYPGSYDATFGHFAGGIIDAATRGARRDGQHGEAQLRVFDVSTAVELTLPHQLGITMSGSYGWPGLLVQLFAPGTDVQFGDYQLRADWKGLTLQLLGSYDSIKRREGQRYDEFRLTFHRLQLRYQGRRGRVAYEAALVGGYDQMINFGGNGVDKTALGWRGNLQARWRRVSLQVGIDGELSRFAGSNFDKTPGASPNSLGELAGNRSGVVAGAFAALSVDLVPGRVNATLSGRVDEYHAERVTLVGIDPRLNLRAQLWPRLLLKAGGGVYHQPPTFPVALPGVDTFALSLGLQRAYHSSLGLEATLPLDFTLSLTGYYQRFANISDSTLDFHNVTSCSADPPESLRGTAAQIMRQVDGQAYGGELLLRRHKGTVTGWIAYTVGRSERFLPCGARPSDFDQTHTLNAVMQVRLPRAFSAGVRFYVATGRPGTRVDLALGYDTPRNNWRMPTYVQLDARVDREWIFKKWALSAFVEVVNMTYSESALAVEYPYDEMLGVTRLDQPRVSGFRWVLPSLGARGRF